MERFLSAQADVYDQALAELRAGRKRTHWMWFVFPQVRGLGRTPTAVHYAIADLAEAVRYAEHPVLGARLRECCAALLQLDQTDPLVVLGDPDHLKLQSSMTLFAVATGEPVFDEVLAQYYGGVRDPRSLALLTDDASSGPAAVPGLDPSPHELAEPVVCTLEVNGERFALRRRGGSGGGGGAQYR